jgi:hypothetical protein
MSSTKFQAIAEAARQASDVTSDAATVPSQADVMEIGAVCTPVAFWQLG